MNGNRPASPSRPIHPALAAAIALGLGTMSAACELFEDEGNGESKPYAATHELDLGLEEIEFALVTADIPKTSRGIGIVTAGTDENLKFIDHGLLVAPPYYITDPSGNEAPLSFPQRESEDDPSILVNYQAAALFFPNDGSEGHLKKGTWTFPVGSLNAAADNFQSDTLRTIVYYKTGTSERPVLNLNVFVVNGINPAITDTASAESDEEIQGAVGILRGLFEEDPAIDVDTAIEIQFIDPVYDATDDVLDSLDEWYALNSQFPEDPSHDAMNIFVVSSLEFLEAGVIGVSPGAPGPFNRQGTILSGTVAEYMGDGTGTLLGTILAHEFAHYLGLHHTSEIDGGTAEVIGEDPIPDTDLCTTEQLQESFDIDDCPDRNNLMFPYLVEEDQEPEISEGQGTVIRLNPGVSPP
jgi:hypothetical protein